MFDTVYLNSIAQVAQSNIEDHKRRHKINETLIYYCKGLQVIDQDGPILIMNHNMETGYYKLNKITNTLEKYNEIY